MTEGQGGVVEGGDQSAFRVFSRPNFFELYLSESVPGLAEGAFCALWRRARGPLGLGRVSGHTAFALVRALCDAACLWRAGTTPADALAGVQRVDARSGSSTGPLTGAQKLGLVALGAGVPLLAHALRRCARHHFAGVYTREIASIKEGDVDDDKSKTRTSSARVAWLRTCDRAGRIAARLLPWLRGTRAFAAALLAVAFLADLSRAPTLSDLILGTTPVRVTSNNSNTSNNGITGLVPSALRLVLPLLAFGYRSVEWFYAVPHAHAAALTAGRTQLEWAGRAVPPPPAPPPPAPGVTLPADSTRCPLCGRARRLPAVLAASGYAFCFPCVVRYVRQYHRCPITGVPAHESQIHRLYLK